MAEWTADIEVTAGQAQRLIEKQFPDLAPARVERLGTGWDNTAFLVNGEWVFRFPRRKFFAHLTERETVVLPRLAPLLPLSVPEPVLLGSPAEDYPFVFAGYRFITGTPGSDVGWSDAARARCAAPLGEFLRALHAIPVDDRTLAEGPGDEIERANMRRRLPMLRERAAALRGGASEALRLAEELADAPPHAGRPCWVHGDLYARHLLVDGSRTITGVIDWGDAHLGDPALDLSIALSFLPAAARADFRAAYGPIEETAWRRASFRALFYGIVLTHYGRQTGDVGIRSAGEYSLGSVLAGE